MVIQTEYKGHTIIFDEFDETWSCETVKSRLTTLSGIKGSIDKHIKNEKAFTRVAVISLRESAWQGRKFGASGEVTSINEDGDAWTVWGGGKGGSREKIDKRNFDGLCLDTPENRKKVAEVLEKMRDIRMIQDEIKEVKNSIPKFTA